MAAVVPAPSDDPTLRATESRLGARLGSGALSDALSGSDVRGRPGAKVFRLQRRSVQLRDELPSISTHPDLQSGKLEIGSSFGGCPSGTTLWTIGYTDGGTNTDDEILV